MGCNMITSRVPQTWPGVASYLTEQHWHKWSMWLTGLGATEPANQPPIDLVQRIQGCVKWGSPPLSVVGLGKGAFWCCQVGESVGCSSGCTGGRVERCALKWSYCHLSQTQYTFTMFFLAFGKILLLSESVFEIQIKSAQNCIRRLCCCVIPAAQKFWWWVRCWIPQCKSSIFGSFPVPPSTWRRAKTAAKATLMGSHGSFCSVILQLGRSLSWGRRSDAVLSLTHRAQNLLPQGTG